MLKRDKPWEYLGRGSSLSPCQLLLDTDEWGWKERGGQRQAQSGDVQGRASGCEMQEGREDTKRGTVLKGEKGRAGERERESRG